MSGQWEVVGKKRDKASKLPVAKHNTGTPKIKKNPSNDLKIEDVLPKSQLQNLYNSNKSNKENKKPGEKPKTQDIPKKNQKKDKTQESVKTKPPKSIESALNNIDQEDLKILYDNSQSHFPDAPVIWLKELLQFLNQKLSLEVQDPVFSSKKDGYPLNVVPAGIKGIIENAISQAGKSNTLLFFDICLTSMASDMSKDLSALGNKILLQFIAQREPSLIFSNISKYIQLKNSYQNRPNIGLSILWAVGHVAVTDFQSGLQVFQQLFLPLIEMKNYSRYIASYLSKLLDSREGITITKEEFLLLLDTIHSNKKNLPNDLKLELSEKLLALKPILFKNKKEKYSTFFDLILKKNFTNGNKSYQDCICDILIDIFHNDESTLANWCKIYSKNLAASAILLKYIGDNWNSVSKRINRTTFLHMLDNFKSINGEYSSKKNIEGLKDAVTAIETINEKMVAKKSSGSVLKVLLITSLILSQIIVGVFFYDTWQNGKFDETRIKQKFKDFGIYPAFEYLQIANGYVCQGASWVDYRLEENFPGYRKTISEVLDPYVHLIIDTYKIIRTGLRNTKVLILENYPAFLQSIDYYAPGLMEKSQETISNAYSTSSFYVHSSVDYLKKEVFTGQLSPENVQRVVSEAFNTTQQKASEYYHWIYEKVQTTIK